MQYTLTPWWLFRKNCSSPWIHHFLLLFMLSSKTMIFHILGTYFCGFESWTSSIYSSRGNGKLGIIRPGGVDTPFHTLPSWNPSAPSSLPPNPDIPGPLCIRSELTSNLFFSINSSVTKLTVFSQPPHLFSQEKRNLDRLFKEYYNM